MFTVRSPADTVRGGPRVKVIGEAPPLQSEKMTFAPEAENGRGVFNVAAARKRGRLRHLAPPGPAPLTAAVVSRAQ